MTDQGGTAPADRASSQDIRAIYEHIHARAQQLAMRMQPDTASKLHQDIQRTTELALIHLNNEGITPDKVQDAPIIAAATSKPYVSRAELLDMMVEAGRRCAV